MAGFAAFGFAADGFAFAGVVLDEAADGASAAEARVVADLPAVGLAAAERALDGFFGADFGVAGLVAVGGVAPALKVASAAFVVLSNASTSIEATVSA